MAIGVRTPEFVHGEFELLGRRVDYGEVHIDEDMAEVVRSYVSQEFLPAITNRRVVELDQNYDLTQGASSYSFPRSDGLMRSVAVATSMHHGMDTWTCGVWLSESLTGNVQHRKINSYRIIQSAGKVLEASVLKRFILDRPGHSTVMVPRRDYRLQRRAFEEPLTEPECWRLLEHMDNAKRNHRPSTRRGSTYLGIPLDLYPLLPDPRDTNES